MQRTKSVHSTQTHPNPNNLPHLTPPRLENRLDVRAARARLVGDAALDQFAGVVCGELTRDPDLRGGFDGLGVGGGRYGMEVSKVGGRDGMLGDGMARSGLVGWVGLGWWEMGWDGYQWIG